MRAYYFSLIFIIILLLRCCLYHVFLLASKNVEGVLQTSACVYCLFNQAKTLFENSLAKAIFPYFPFHCVIHTHGIQQMHEIFIFTFPGCCCCCYPDRKGSVGDGIWWIVDFTTIFPYIYDSYFPIVMCVCVKEKPVYSFHHLTYELDAVVVAVWYDFHQTQFYNFSSFLHFPLFVWTVFLSSTISTMQINLRR